MNDCDIRLAARITGINKGDQDDQVQGMWTLPRDVYFNADRRGVDVYCLQCGSRRFFRHEDMRDLTVQKVEDAQAVDDV